MTKTEIVETEVAITAARKVFVSASSAISDATQTANQAYIQAVKPQVDSLKKIGVSEKRIREELRAALLAAHFSTAGSLVKIADCAELLGLTKVEKTGRPVNEDALLDAEVDIEKLVQLFGTKWESRCNRAVRVASAKRKAGK